METEATTTAEGMRPDGKPAHQEVQHVDGSDPDATGGRFMSWQQWGIVLGAMVAGVTLYHLAVSPARESARSEAQIRATLDQHTAAIANLEKQTETDRKSVADRFDILRERLDAAGKDTAGLRLDIAAIRGQLGVLLERTKK